MIGAFIRHGALSSKVRVLYGQRLTVEDFLELLKKKSVGEIAGFLKESPAYMEALSGINEKLVHRGQLESILRRKLFEDYIKLYNFANGSDKVTLKNLFIKYEIDQILSFLSFLKAGITEEFIYSIPEFIIKQSKIDFVKMSKCTSFEAFLEVIEKTKYHSILINYKNLANTDFAELETLLYSYYYANLYKVVLPLFKGNMEKQFGKSVGSQIDILNITRIIRLKEYYNTEPKNVLLHILPFYYKLNKDTIERMVQCKTSSEVLEIVKKTAYNKLFLESTNVYIEQYLYRFIKEFSHFVMATGLPSVNVPIAYLNLKDIEIRNIISIIEGKRYNMSVEEIKRHLLAF